MITRRALLASSLPLMAQSVEAGFAPLSDWTGVDANESDFAISGGEIAVSPVAAYPSWLRSEREFENFDLRGEFFIKGWTDSGFSFHAPWQGRPWEGGCQVKIFHQKEERPTPWSAGAILPVAAPRRVSVREGWNTMRILADHPRLQVWMNDELVQDLNTDAHPMLKDKLRSGHFGIAACSAPCRFRNLRVRELPARERWDVLYNEPADLERNWSVSEGKPVLHALGAILRADGSGHLASRERYRDFEFQCYIRAARQHNGGILFRSSGRGLAGEQHYEIQLHNVPEAHYPTGSLYNLQRAKYPRIQDERWYLFELRVQGASARVRIDGETVMTYGRLERLGEGFIELQAHRPGHWTEFRRVRVQRL
jgi:hypothetical protein